MTTKISQGLDGQSYLVFEDNVQAYEIATLLDIGLHCFDGYENAVLAEEYAAASVKALALLQPTAEALALSYTLVDRVGQRCETPPSWSFDERDTSRETSRLALAQIQDTVTLRT